MPSMQEVARHYRRLPGGLRVITTEHDHIPWRISGYALRKRAGPGASADQVVEGGDDLPPALGKIAVVKPGFKWLKSRGWREATR